MHSSRRCGLDSSCGRHELYEFFYSMHRRGNGDMERYKTVLSKYKVGEMAPSKDKVYEYDTEFANELYAEVAKVLPPSKWWAPTAFWIRTAFICVMTLVSELGWILTGHWIFCVLTGLFHAQIGLAVQHDASHGAMSRNAKVNTFFAYGADWIGNSRWLWFEQHIVGHHPNTNDIKRDPDATSAEPLLLFGDC